MELISREAVFDEISSLDYTMTECGKCLIDSEDLQKRIICLPTAPAAPQWIPVSERLPEVGRNVLLSVGKGLYTAEGELKHDGTWAQYRWSANIENVDAWAEMPEPWRGEEDE